MLWIQKQLPGLLGRFHGIKCLSSFFVFNYCISSTVSLMIRRCLWMTLIHTVMVHEWIIPRNKRAAIIEQWIMVSHQSSVKRFSLVTCCACLLIFIFLWRKDEGITAWDAMSQEEWVYVWIWVNLIRLIYWQFIFLSYRLQTSNGPNTHQYQTYFYLLWDI